MDLMAIRRGLLAQESGTTITVIWNNLYNGYLSADDYKDRNTSETTTTFDNGVATTTFINLAGEYRTLISKNSVRTYAGHKYFSMFNCSINQAIDVIITIGMDVANIPWNLLRTAGLNEWGTYSYIVTGRTDRNSTLYVSRLYKTGGLPSGIIAKAKNVLVVDLTLMYGAGNEPSTTDEFIRQCELNGIDLNTPHPVDNGTSMSWRI